MNNKLPSEAALKRATAMMEKVHNDLQNVLNMGLRNVMFEEIIEQNALPFALAFTEYEERIDKCRKALENPATKSAITFLEAYFADRPCDNDAVSHCVKCNTNYLLSEIALASLAELEAGKGREG